MGAIHEARMDDKGRERKENENVYISSYSKDAVEKSDGGGGCLCPCTVRLNGMKRLETC